MFAAYLSTGTDGTDLLKVDDQSEFWSTLLPNDMLDTMH